MQQQVIEYIVINVVTISLVTLLLFYRSRRNKRIALKALDEEQIREDYDGPKIHPIYTDDMIGSEIFFQVVAKYFSYLEFEYGYKQGEKTVNSFRYNRISYTSSNIEISVSYEYNGSVGDKPEGYLEVWIYLLDKLDKRRHGALRLHLLREYIYKQVSNEDVLENNNYFVDQPFNTIFEQEAIKLAKDLRLCLNNSDKWNQYL